MQQLLFDPYSNTCQVTVLPVAIQDSDNDGLSDTDGNNIYWIDPYNPDSDGDRIIDGVEISNGTDPNLSNSQNRYTKIWLEAEDGDMYAPMEVGDDTNASGHGYIMAPEETGMISDPSPAQASYAEYTFNVSSAGDYVIWGRVIAADTGSNSFFITVDRMIRIMCRKE